MTVDVCDCVFGQQWTSVTGFYLESLELDGST